MMMSMRCVIIQQGHRPSVQELLMTPQIDLRKRERKLTQQYVMVIITSEPAIVHSRSVRRN